MATHAKQVGPMDILVADVIRYLCLWLDPISLSRYHQVSRYIRDVTMVKEIWVHNLAASALKEHQNEVLRRARMYNIDFVAGPSLRFLASMTPIRISDSESACSTPHKTVRSRLSLKRLGSGSSIRSWISSKAQDAVTPLRRRSSEISRSSRQPKTLPLDDQVEPEPPLSNVAPACSRTTDNEPQIHADPSQAKARAKRLSARLHTMLRRSSARRQVGTAEGGDRPTPLLCSAIEEKCCKLEALARFLSAQLDLADDQRPWLPKLAGELATLAAENQFASALALLCGARAGREEGASMLVGPAVCSDLLAYCADKGHLQTIEALLTVDGSCHAPRIAETAIERAIEASVKQGQTSSVGYLFGAFLSSLTRRGLGTFNRMLKVSRMLQVGVRLAVERNQGPICANLLLILRARARSPEFLEHLPDLFESQVNLVARKASAMGHHETVSHLMSHPSLGECMRQQDVLDTIVRSVTRNAHGQVLDVLVAHDLITPKMVAEGMLSATVRGFAEALKVLLATGLVTQPCIEVCMTEALRRGHDDILELLEGTMKVDLTDDL